MNGLELENNKVDLSEERQKILVVCMLDSIHTARWLSLFKEQKIDFYLFPSTPNRVIHSQIKKLINQSNASNAKYKLASSFLRASIPIWILGLISKLFIPATLIKKIVRKESINKIHAIELNHAGYLVAKAYRLGLPAQLKIISTNWGSDIYWFQQYPSHLKRIKELLAITNFYSAECKRDIELAFKYGYQGLVNEVMPNTGGFEILDLSKATQLPADRKAIIIKGYESFVGRASIALNAIEQVSPQLAGYEINIISANRKTKKIAERLIREKRLNIKVHAKKSLSHDQVLDLFRKSRIYVGISLSDAISTSLLESIVSGAYPIQTNTSCANEWIEHGISGSIVEPNSEEVAKELIMALMDDSLVNNAALINRSTAISRLDNEKIKAKIQNFYNF